MKYIFPAWIAATVVTIGCVNFAAAQSSTQVNIHPLPVPPLPVKQSTNLPPVPPAPVHVAPTQLSNNIIAWDAETKEYTAKSGEPSAPFTFYLTNVSSGDVIINGVTTSCGCTTAKLPPMPWKLVAGTNGEINVSMNIAGRSGVNMKTVTVNTDKGSKMLTVKATIQPPPPATNSAVATPPAPPTPPVPVKK